MKINKIYILIILILLIIPSATKSKKILLLTKEELKKYNGKNGNPAYVAVNGIIYDVTDFPLWKKGNHKSKHEAGNDLTNEIKKSPHGSSKLKKLEIVGKLVIGLTIEELKKYNGQNGNPAFISVNGIVYDVTNSKLWKKGNHKSKHEAGNDLTNEIKKSPHGPARLKRLTIVGKIIKK